MEGLTELQKLQSAEIANEVVSKMKEHLVCQEACIKRMSKLRISITFLFCLSSLALGLKLWQIVSKLMI
jgi:hypothetical protein